MFKKSAASLLLAVTLLLSGCQLGVTGQVQANQTDGLTQTAADTAAAEKTDSESGNDPATGSQASQTTNPDSQASEPPPAATTTPEAQAPIADPIPADAEFTLAASGDVLSHITNTRAAKQSDGSYDFLPQMEEIRDLLTEADYTLVNLESPIAGEQFGYRGFPKFNAPVNLGVTLKELGVDLAITSNNHAMDNGMDGLMENLDNLDQIGLAHTGTYRTQEEADQAFIQEINGIRVGFVATTYGTNNIPVPDKYAVDLNSHTRIRTEIAEAREQGAELIVYHIHWGKEYTEYPSQKQMDTYRVLTEEGVDVIIGSHPHRLQPMEMRQITYEGKVKNQAVIWSTGNLWQGQIKKRDYINLGSVFRIDVQRRNGVAQVADLDYDLVYNLRWKVDGKEQYRVIPREDMALYQEDFPVQYEKMKEEFQWGDKTLSRSVDVIYSDGTKPDQP